jgi:hypothetical protein
MWWWKRDSDTSEIRSTKEGIKEKADQFSRLVQEIKQELDKSDKENETNDEYRRGRTF